MLHLRISNITGSDHQEILMLGPQKCRLLCSRFHHQYHCQISSVRPKSLLFQPGKDFGQWDKLSPWFPRRSSPYPSCCQDKCSFVKDPRLRFSRVLHSCEGSGAPAAAAATPSSNTGPFASPIPPIHTQDGVAGRLYAGRRCTQKTLSSKNNFPVHTEQWNDLHS